MWIGRDVKKGHRGILMSFVFYSHTVKSVSKGQTFLPSPYFSKWFFFFKHQKGRGVSDSLLRVWFCLDALQHKTDSCSSYLWNQGQACWTHCPGTTPLKQVWKCGFLTTCSQVRVQARNPLVTMLHHPVFPASPYLISSRAQSGWRDSLF